VYRRGSTGDAWVTYTEEQAHYPLPDGAVVLYGRGSPGHAETGNKAHHRHGRADIGEQ